ncbi:MAG: aldo/keto reductase [Spirochaetes bacterium]|nr:aldo/keto reductase [Spirochaetota bacterium]
MHERVRFGRTGLMVTRLAFGGIPIQRLSRQEGVRLVADVLDLGINFIDTAHGYGHSEELVGEAMRTVSRGSLVIATKSPAADRKGFLDDLDESLRRLRTDYIDIFQFHGVSSREKMAAVMGPGGAQEGMEEGIRAGKIRFPGFSSHSLPVAAGMIRTGRFDAVQVPFNFVDCQAAEELIPLARRADLGIIAMKPLGGGLLDDARLCFRFLRQYPDLVPDPGIETLPQLREIIDVMESGGPLSAEEIKRIEHYRERLGREWCHRCDYCQPCPRNIPISTVLVAKSFAVRLTVERFTSIVEAPLKAAESCEECRQCVERCPYHLDIPVLLKKQRGIWERYRSTGTWE